MPHQQGWRPPYGNTMKYHNNLNYCWSHGFDVENGHTSQTCKAPKASHQWYAMRFNNLGGSRRSQHKFWQGPPPRHGHGHDCGRYEGAPTQGYMPYPGAYGIF
eukprot:1669222-Ditylum_brightwellii.AAC.1